MHNRKIHKKSTQQDLFPSFPLYIFFSSGFLHQNFLLASFLFSLNPRYFVFFFMSFLYTSFLPYHLFNLFSPLLHILRPSLHIFSPSLTILPILHIPLILTYISPPSLHSLLIPSYLPPPLHSPPPLNRTLNQISRQRHRQVLPQRHGEENREDIAIKGPFGGR